MSRKVAFLGGGGVRTPLVIFGINESRRHLDVDELVLFDVDRDRAEIIAALGREVVRANEGTLSIRVADTEEDAVEGASFVLNSIRVGGIAARAADERAATECGYPGQETTGPAGIAMGQRTIPVAIRQARMVALRAPSAWFINFTNPAGLITQAISQQSSAKVVGICDTPTEMLHRIQAYLQCSPPELHCDYIGLNHLGWIRRIALRGQDITDRLLDDDDFLNSIYSAPLFDHELVRALRLIPTEYLFFYYSQRRALENARRQQATRGEQIGRLNEELLRKLANSSSRDGLQAYIDYLNQRSGSYMKLEAGSSLNSAQDLPEVDPFRAASGYHRIALDVMNALSGSEPREVIVNTRNGATIDGIDPDDVIEASSVLSNGTISPVPVGPLPLEVRGLVLAVKAYERAAIQAALSGSERDLRKSILLHPAIAEWEPSAELLRTLRWQ